MKKRQSILAMILAILLLCTACGAASNDAATQETAAVETVWTETPAEEAIEDEEAEISYDADINTSSQNSSDGMTVEEVQTYAEKIIYSGRVYMETTEFDDAVAALDRAVKEFGGFVQDSSVNGNARRYEDGTTVVEDRWAHYVVRIPAAKFDAFMALTDGIGNVTSSSRTAENVTSQYTDYEARLESLYTQEERLLVMLEQSGDLESLITLEERLSEVRYEIESIERNLRNLDQKLSYSTITLELQEVEVVTQTTTVQRTFGQKLADACSSGWNSFVVRLQRFILNVARSLPTLVILAVLAVAVILVVRRIRKKHAQTFTKAQEKGEETEEQ